MGGHEGGPKLKVLAVIATGIIVFSLLFESAKEKLSEHTSEAMKPIIAALFSELTTLGFIGLMLFVVFEFEWIGELSAALFESEETIDELADEAHMVLFLIMVLFLAQVVGLVVLGERIQRKWHEWELVATAHCNSRQHAESAAEMSAQRAHQPTTLWGLFHRRFALRLSESQRRALYAMTRSRFMAAQEVTHPHFEFATYLSTALGTTIADFVEIPARVWLCIEVLLLLVVWVFLSVDPDQAFVAWIALGFLCGPLATFVTHAKIRAILQIHCADSTFVNSQLSPEACAEAGAGEVPLETLLLSPPCATPACAGAVLEQSRLMALATAGLGLETSLLSRYESNFWLGARTKTRTTLDVMRIITFGQSIYLAIFLVVYGTQLFDADRERANGAQSQLAKCSSLPAALALAALALVPPCLTVVKMYRIIEDFTVVAHVDSFANRRIVQQVLRRQKTVAAFAALRVVQCFTETNKLSDAVERHTSAVLLHSADENGAPQRSTSDAFLGAFSRCCRRTSGVTLVSTTSATTDEISLLKRRRHWRTVFDVFDSGDSSGAIDKDEIRTLLGKFAHTAACDVDAVLLALDTDGSGSIGFEEFFAFSSVCEDARDDTVLNNRMFELVDEDGSGSITIDELHNVFTRLGQEVSLDDVYSIIADIDEDGNGILDAEEFSILLKRLHV